MDCCSFLNIKLDLLSLLVLTKRGSDFPGIPGARVLVSCHLPEGHVKPQRCKTGRKHLSFFEADMLKTHGFPVVTIFQINPLNVALIRRTHLNTCSSAFQHPRRVPLGVAVIFGSNRKLYRVAMSCARGVVGNKRARSNCTQE